MSGDPREEIWSKAFNAALTSGELPEIAMARAEDALELHERRWPLDRPEASLSGMGVDYTMLKNAIAQLKAENRFEARLVLASLLKALVAAQEKGQKLTAWAPPPRGAEID